MNQTLLGDGLDEFKGSVVRQALPAFLAVGGVLCVVPMFTGKPGSLPWSNGALQAYKAVFTRGSQTGNVEVLCANKLFEYGKWELYFATAEQQARALQGSPDFFLDPDNGLEPKKTHNKRHLPLKALCQITKAFPDSVVSFYQHQPRKGGGNARYFLATYQRLQAKLPFVSGIWGGMASVYFTTESATRQASVANGLKAMAGLLAGRRVRPK